MADLDQLSQKFNELGITQRERPVLPKGKRLAHHFFMQHMNKVLKENHQSFNRVGDLSKYCSKKWKEMSKTEKSDFEKLSEKDGKRFAKELAQYEKVKELYDKFVDEVHDKCLIHELAVKQKHSFATNSRSLAKRLPTSDDLRSNEHKAVVGKSSQSDNSEEEDTEEESDNSMVFNRIRNIKKKEKNNNMEKSGEEEEEDFDEENVSSDDGEGSDGSFESMVINNTRSEGESGVDDEEQSGGSDEE